MGLLFLGADVTYKPGVGNCAAFGDFGFGDKEDCVGTFDSVSNSLCQSTKLIDGGVIPGGFGVRVGYELFVWDWFPS